MLLTLPLLLTPDNDDLLCFASTLRVELEYLIYTLEQHRTGTRNRYTAARERLAAGLVKFLNVAVVGADAGRSLSASPQEASKGTPPTTVDSVRAGAEDAGCPGKETVEETVEETAESLEETAESLEETAKSHTPSSDAKVPPPPHAPLPQQNRSLWIPDIPSSVTPFELLSQICGGAIESLATYHHHHVYSASITFLTPSSAQAYFTYTRTPSGRLSFPSAPSSWVFTAVWNPRPPPLNHRVLTMALNPRVAARRTLIVKNLPSGTVTASTLTQRLKGLGGKISTSPRIVRVVLDSTQHSAVVETERIGCAMQLMEAKLHGRWGTEFSTCTLTFGADPCDQRIPGWPAPTVPPAPEPNDHHYAQHRAHPLFPSMRSLSILHLPPTTTLSILSAQLHGSGPLERLTLRPTANKLLAATVTFMDHRSAVSWYEHHQRDSQLTFPGLSWTWPAHWNPAAPEVPREIMAAFNNPAVRARRVFRIDGLRGCVDAATLIRDINLQSRHGVLFESCDVDAAARSAVVVMSSIGAAIGGVARLKRLQRYRACRFRFLKDPCELESPLVLQPTTQTETSSPPTAHDTAEVSPVAGPSCQQPPSPLPATVPVDQGTTTLTVTGFPPCYTDARATAEVSRVVRAAAWGVMEVRDAVVGVSVLGCGKERRVCVVVAREGVARDAVGRMDRRWECSMGVGGVGRGRVMGDDGKES